MNAATSPSKEPVLEVDTVTEASLARARREMAENEKALMEAKAAAAEARKTAEAHLANAASNRAKEAREAAKQKAEEEAMIAAAKAAANHDPFPRSFDGFEGEGLAEHSQQPASTRSGGTYRLQRAQSSELTHKRKAAKSKEGSNEPMVMGSVEHLASLGGSGEESPEWLMSGTTPVPSRPQSLLSDNPSRPQSRRAISQGSRSNDSTKHNGRSRADDEFSA